MTYSSRSPLISEICVNPAPGLPTSATNAYPNTSSPLTAVVTGPLDTFDPMPAANVLRSSGAVVATPVHSETWISSARALDGVSVTVFGPPLQFGTYQM